MQVPEPITRRNWILHGLYSPSYVCDSSSDSGIVPSAPFSTLRRQNRPETDSVSAFYVSAAPVFPQSRFRSVSSHGGVGVMERINHVNDLNERISATYHRRHGTSSDSENASGSTKAPSFSRRATLLVDQSFSFIDNELIGNERRDVDCSSHVPASPPSSEGSYSPSREGASCSEDTEKTEASSTSEEVGRRWTTRVTSSNPESCFRNHHTPKTPWILLPVLNRLLTTTVRHNIRQIVVGLKKRPSQCRVLKYSSTRHPLSANSSFGARTTTVKYARYMRRNESQNLYLSPVITTMTCNRYE